jgi:radical SAM protein with 4Fe4S-binding SPASM domain
MSVQSFFPSTVLIEPTNICNLGCSFCEANCTVNKGLKRRELLPEDLDLMLGKLRPYIANLVFQGDCEPTLNRYLPELVAVAAKYTTSIAMVTNGTRLSEDLTRRLIDNGMSWFALSIDDHRSAIYNNIRIRADLDKVVENLRRLIHIRDTEQPHLHTVVHKIVFPNDTLASLVEFVKFFYLDCGVNQITFAPLVEVGDIKVREWLILRNQLESALLSEGIYINLREFGNYPYKTIHKYCGTNLFFINHMGDFSPCGLHVRLGRTFGNLLTDSLDDIAARQRFQEFHRFWSRKDYAAPLPEQCDNCYLLKGHYHRYTLNEGQQAGLAFANKHDDGSLSHLPPATGDSFIRLDDIGVSSGQAQ